MANRRTAGLIKSKGILIAMNKCYSSKNIYMNSYSNTSNNNNLNDALKLFDVMLDTRPMPCVFEFNKMLDDVTNRKHYSVSLDMFNQMCSLGLPVDTLTMNIAIKCCCHLYRTRDYGFTVLARCFKLGIVPDVSTYNTLLNGFILEDKTHEAERLFKKLFRYHLCDSDLLIYNTMIKGLSKIGNHLTAIALLRLIEGRGGGVQPNVDTYNPIIDGFCKDVVTIDDAFKFFNEMVLHKAISPNVFTYNSLIFSLSKLGRWDDVTRMLKQMQAERISPDVTTFAILVDELCKQGKIKEAEVVIRIIIDSGAKYPFDLLTYNSLIDAYCLHGDMNKAKAIFDSMLLTGIKPNLVTYNSLLNGYCMDWKIDEAIHFYNEIFEKKDAEPKPNAITKYIMYRVSMRFRHKRDGGNKPSDPSLLSAEQLTIKKWPYCFLLNDLCDANRLEDALSLFRFMDPTNLNSNIRLYNFLIDCAGKCGELDMARHLFHQVFVKNLQPDIKTYTVMISGLCRGGLLKEAKQLFLKMEKSCPPDTLWKNSIIINDLFQGYLRNKPLDDVFMLFQEMEARHYRLTVSTVTLIMDICVAGEPHNTLYRLIREGLPEERKDDPFLPRDYYAFCDEE